MVTTEPWLRDQNVLAHAGREPGKLQDVTDPQHWWDTIWNKIVIRHALVSSLKKFRSDAPVHVHVYASTPPVRISYTDSPSPSDLLAECIVNLVRNASFMVPPHRMEYHAVIGMILVNLSDSRQTADHLVPMVVFKLYRGRGAPPTTAWRFMTYDPHGPASNPLQTGGWLDARRVSAAAAASKHMPVELVPAPMFNEEVGIQKIWGGGLCGVYGTHALMSVVSQIRDRLYDAVSQPTQWTEDDVDAHGVPHGFWHNIHEPRDPRKMLSFMNTVGGYLSKHAVAT